VPAAAKIVEIVDVKPAEVDLERLENVRDLHVLLLGFDAIHVDVNLRNAGAEGGEEPAQLGATMGGIDQVLSRRLELLGRSSAGTVFNLHREPAGVANPTDCRRLQHDGLASFHPAELLVEPVRDSGRGHIGPARALAERRQAQEQ
jgi:hypothetical protein